MGELIALVVLALPGFILGWPVAAVAMYVSERKAREAVACTFRTHTRHTFARLHRMLTRVDGGVLLYQHRRSRWPAATC